MIGSAGLRLSGAHSHLLWSPEMTPMPHQCPTASQVSSSVARSVTVVWKSLPPSHSSLYELSMAVVGVRRDASTLNGEQLCLTCLHWMWLHMDA